MAAMLAEGDQECVGFSLRLQRMTSTPPATLDTELVNALVQLTSQAGRLPLADMLTEVQFIAERHLIAQALRHAGGRHDAAARALGLTVDGLELRMRRHHLPADEGRVDKPLLN
jgi:transcriptional regulator with GAF, ATPase, and Fis domain